MYGNADQLLTIINARNEAVARDYRNAKDDYNRLRNTVSRIARWLKARRPTEQSNPAIGEVAWHGR